MLPAITRKAFAKFVNMKTFVADPFLSIKSPEKWHVKPMIDEIINKSTTDGVENHSRTTTKLSFSVSV